MIAMRHILCAAVCVLFFQLSAQKHHFAQYSIDMGLSQSQVTSISQFKTGELLVATQSGGLNVFDGKEFHPLFTEVINGAAIWQLFRAKDSTVWAASDNGLYHIKSLNSIERLGSFKDLKTSSVWSVYEDSRGLIWIGTSDQGLYVYNGKTFRHFGINDGLEFSAINSIGEDKEGTIWVGSFGYGIAKISNYVAENVTRFYGLVASVIYKIYSSSDSTLMLATDAGVWYKDEEGFIQLPYLSEDDHSLAYSGIAQDSAGVMWFVTESKGIIQYDTRDNTKSYITHDNGLETNYLFNVYVDHNANCWFGTDGAGVLLYKGAAFKSYDRTTGLSSNQVLVIHEEKDGSVWVGTDRGLDFMLPDSSMSPKLHFDVSNSVLLDNMVHCIFRQNDTLYIGTDLGLNYIVNRELHTVKGFSSPVYRIVRFQGRLLIASELGVYSLKKGLISLDSEHSNNQEGVNELWVSDKGDLFVLSSEKVYQFTSRGRITLDTPNETKGFIGICEDKNSNTYIAHQGGVLLKRSNGSWKNYTTVNGLNHSTSYFIEFADSFLWYGHSSGLDRITIDSVGNILDIYSFNQDDGFMGIETNDKAFAKSANNTYWIGTVKGLFYFDANKFIPDNHPPVLSISGLKIDHGAIDWKEEYPDFDKGGLLPSKPVFSYTHNNITIDFKALDYINPDKVRYSFKLDGYDLDWSPLSSDVTVSYTSLPPGQYTFMVKSVDQNGNWSNVASYSFEIEGPFYTKTWFLIVCTVLAAILIYLFMMIRTRRLSRSKRRLEELVRQRTDELRGINRNLERLSLVAREIYDAVLICDGNGEIEWYNHSFHQMAGYKSLEEFQRSKLSEIHNLKQLGSYENIHAVIQGFHSNKKPHRYDSYHLNKLGEKRWTSGTLTPIYNKQGELANIIGVYTDITDRKRFEEELKVKNMELEQLSMVARRMNEAVIICDELGYIKYYNHSYHNSLGYNENEFKELMKDKPRLHDLTTEFDVEALIQDFHTDSTPSIQETHQTTKTGETRWTTSSLTPVYRDGILRNIVIVSTDITQRRLLSDRITKYNKDLTDSIVYAKQIQRAVLPSPEILDKHFEDNFILYKPKDIVSGDFYWFSNIRGVFFLAAADCTGHGVPGAFMSMIGNEFLHQIVNKSYIDSTGKALAELDKLIVRSLHQDVKGSNNTTKDGMDIALMAIEIESLNAQFSGAFNPLYIIRNGEIIIYNATKESIGGSYTGQKTFDVHDIQLQKRDCVYMFSDGFTDQFGGPKDASQESIGLGKKFTRQQFRSLLIEVSRLPMKEQHDILNKHYEEWKGDLNQIDDVLVVGFRV